LSLKEVEPKRRTKVEILTSATRGARREVDARALEFCNKNALLILNQKSLENQQGSAVSSLDGRGAKELGKLLCLKDPVKRIECYDISHTQGESAVGSRVVFLDGKPAPHLYRKFNIKTVNGVDDYASIQEVLERRFRRSWINGAGGQVDEKDPWSIPDLVVIDGGQGQLNAAIKGMSKAMVYPSKTSSDPGAPRSAIVPICSLAKDKEEVFVPGRSTPVNQTPDSPALLLLRSLRDESHRFALKSHRHRRSLTKKS
jgi:excinuclease ABC subunit C